MRKVKKDGALELLKRHSGIVLDPGGSREGREEPFAPPYFRGAAQARSPSASVNHHVRAMTGVAQLMMKMGGGSGGWWTDAALGPVQRRAKKLTNQSEERAGAVTKEQRCAVFRYN